ncbi:MAG: methyltransferase [Bacteroidales bacterium]|nr:methyltransferase [Bacteroidales bacterium]
MAVFHFLQFDVDDRDCGMKICSDSVLLGGWFFRPYPGAARVLDVGSGSGVLALIAAQFCPQALITGIEIDPAAARTSTYNFDHSPWATRLNTFEGSFENFPATQADLIVSNPPYFTNGEKAQCNRRATARHQSSLTYASLSAFAARNLTPHGHLGLVAPAEFEDDIIFGAELAGLCLNRLCRVRTSPRKAPTRILLDFSRLDTTPVISELAIRDENYIALVGDLYTKI